MDAVNDKKMKRPAVKYDVIVREKNGRFILLIPEICCIETDENLEKAYRKLEAARDKTLETMLINGYSDEIPCPKKNQNDIRLGSGVKQFVVKLTAICIALICLMSVADIILEEKLTSLVRRQASQVITKVYQKTASVARQSPAFIFQEMKTIKEKLESMPPEEKEKLLKDIEGFALELQPYFNEFKKTFEKMDNQKDSYNNGYGGSKD